MTIMVYVYCPMSVVTSHHFLPSATQIGVTLNDVTSFPAKIAYKAISSTLQKYFRAYKQLAQDKKIFVRKKKWGAQKNRLIETVLFSTHNKNDKNHDDEHHQDEPPALQLFMFTGCPINKLEIKCKRVKQDGSRSGPMFSRP